MTPSSSSPADCSFPNKQKAEPVKTKRSRRQSLVKQNEVMPKPKAHIAWLDGEISSILAYICKNKPAWENNKSQCTAHFHKLIKERHSPRAIYIKIRSLEEKYHECFEFIKYKGQDKPVRKIIPKAVDKLKFFKECRAAFGMPVYSKGMRLQKADVEAPKEKVVAVQLSAGSSAKRTSPDPAAPSSPPPLAKRSRGAGASINNDKPSLPQVDAEDAANAVPEPDDVSADMAHPSQDSQPTEVQLKAMELQLLIQRVQVKMERSEMRFERLRDKHEQHQEQRRQRLVKCKAELQKLSSV